MKSSCLLRLLGAFDVRGVSHALVPSFDPRSGITWYLSRTGDSSGMNAQKIYVRPEQNELTARAPA